MYSSPPHLRRLSVQIIAGASLLLTAACESAIAPELAAPRQPVRSSMRPERPLPPRLLTQTPQYPATVVYILYREYLHKNPGLKSLSPEDPKYQHYMERRLRQLYPQRGYAGMMKDAVAEARGNRLAWQEYQRRLREWEGTIGIMACEPYHILDPETGEPCGGGGDPPPEEEPADPTEDPSWTDQTEHAVPDDSIIPTLVQEIDTLAMTQPEVNQLYYRESLANGSFLGRRDELIIASTGTRPTIDELIVAAGEGRTPGQVTISGTDVQDIAQAVLSLAVIGWKAHRIVQAAERARDKSYQYYPALAYSNTKRDAYRHIFWNMQMNRYVGGWVAQTVVNGYEQLKPNLPPGREMDFHNNAIGREVKYRSFRGHWLWDRWDWQEWSEKVRNYINRSANAEYIPEWQNESAVTSQAAAQRAASVPNWKYIYFLP